MGIYVLKGHHERLGVGLYFFLSISPNPLVSHTEFWVRESIYETTIQNN